MRMPRQARLPWASFLWAPLLWAPLLWGLLLLGPGPGRAWAGALDGGLIGAVDWDAAFYRPGRPALMSLSLSSLAGFSGTVSAALSNGGGTGVASPAPQPVTLAAGGHETLQFRLVPPAANWRGYHVAIEARDRTSRLVDSASGAFDVATDWNRFPRYCFVTGAALVAGAPVEAALQNLVSYRCNAIQWYDVNWKHHLPYSSAPSWPNLANIRIDRATLQAGLAKARGLGLVNFDYQLWNGAWPGYESDGSGAALAWGLFHHGCDPHCTEQQQLSDGPFPPGWAAHALLQMNAADIRWRSYWITRERQELDGQGFDGVQIDTLGDPGQVTDAAGHRVDLGQALIDFTNAAKAGTRHRVVLNPVSQWNFDAVLRQAAGDVIYTEIHPEFGNVPFFPSLNGLAARVRSGTSRNAVVPAYMETGLALRPGCHTRGGPAVCDFNGPGIRYADAQMIASGLNHWELGELNQACPVRQAKLASNIYVSGPALCMDAALQEWEQDAHNFEVSYETLLRDRVVDAPGTAEVVAGLPAGVAASAVGAAGGVYVLPKTRPGVAILHMLNFSRLASIRLDDVNGAYPAPAVLTGLRIRLRLPAGGQKASRLWWASPDVAHGSVQPLAFEVSGGYAVFTLPRLETWDMIVLTVGAPNL